MWQNLKNLYHLLQAILANFIYGFPSKKLTVIGITGTDGKTTTAHMLYQILRAAKKKTVVITTVGALIDDQPFSIGTHVTTPSPFTVQKILRIARDRGCTHAVIETTSHALDQNRVAGIHFAIGILTNITREHLDYHKTYERYMTAKMKLLKNADQQVINSDDQSYAAVHSRLQAHTPITYSLTKQDADYTPSKNTFKLNVLGDFNVQNALAAYAAAERLGVSRDIIVRALERFTTPKGRQEIVYDKDFRVIVDFAHTPNALEQILRSVRETTQGRLIVVFGSAGRRDAKKRPDMGRAAAKYADIIVLTADDPRDEEVAGINTMITKGITGFTALETSAVSVPLHAKKILFNTLDRQEGINHAVRLAQPGDTIVLAGIGHVQALAMNSGDMQWDERGAVERAIALRAKTPTAAS